MNIACWWNGLLYGFYNLFVTFGYLKDKCEWMCPLQLRFGFGVWSLRFEILGSRVSVYGLNALWYIMDLEFINIASWCHALLYGFYNLFETFPYWMDVCKWMCSIQLRFRFGVWTLGFEMLASKVSVCSFKWIMLGYNMRYSTYSICWILMTCLAVWFLQSFLNIMRYSTYNICWILMGCFAVWFLQPFLNICIASQSSRSKV